jgi:hypothetical protein
VFKVELRYHKNCISVLDNWTSPWNSREVVELLEVGPGEGGLSGHWGTGLEVDHRSQQSLLLSLCSGMCAEWIGSADKHSMWMQHHRHNI